MSDEPREPIDILRNAAADIPPHLEALHMIEAQPPILREAMRAVYHGSIEAFRARMHAWVDASCDAMKTGETIPEAPTI